VTVKPGDLSSLTTQFVHDSARYQSSNAVTRLAVRALVTVASNVLLRFAPSATPAVKAALVALYKQALQALVAGGWLATAQVTILSGLAGAI
jgi:hypothetical protein